MTLDALDDVDLRLFQAIGNKKANELWEMNWKSSSKFPAKPVPESDRSTKEAWIRAKYERKDLVTKNTKENTKVR